MKAITIAFLFLCHTSCNRIRNEDNAIKKGDTVLLNFTYRHPDGKKFDASDHEMHQDKLRSNFPLRIVAGRGDVLTGFDSALTGMKEGDEGKIVLPSNMAFGSKGIKNIIKPNETITVEFHIISIRKTK